MVKSGSRVAVASPMSFSGSTARTMNLLWHDRPVALKIAVSSWLIPVILICWWALDLVWYCLFGILLIPYRILRRGSRKRKREGRMYDELLDALKQQQQPKTD